MKNELQAKFNKVIIIDDNIIEHYVYSRVILNNNFSNEIIEFSLASEALTYLEENQASSQLPQVIFLDLYMPYLSGFDFLEGYDKLSLTVKNSTKVFIVSSSIDDNDITRAYRDPNVVCFQKKPITKEFLDRIVPE
jgi:two-component SAPR family response regulator